MRTDREHQKDHMEGLVADKQACDLTRKKKKKKQVITCQLEWIMKL